MHVCMCVYICACVFVYVCMYVCVHMHLCVCMCIRVCVYGCVYTCPFVLYVHVYVGICGCMGACEFLCICVYVCRVYVCVCCMCVWCFKIYFNCVNLELDIQRRLCPGTMAEGWTHRPLWSPRSRDSEAHFLEVLPQWKSLWQLLSGKDSAQANSKAHLPPLLSRYKGSGDKHQLN